MRVKLILSTYGRICSKRRLSAACKAMQCIIRMYDNKSKAVFADMLVASSFNDLGSRFDRNEDTIRFDNLPGLASHVCDLACSLGVDLHLHLHGLGNAQ